MAYELGQAYVQIMPSAKGISGKISNLLGGEADKAGKTAGGKFSNSFTGALGTLGKATAGALIGASGALLGFSASSVKAGMEFDQSMSQVAATMGLTTDELLEQTGTVELAWGTFTGNLREYAQEMGANTAFSATQASEALNYMALAGYDAQTAMSMLPNVLNLAAAGAMDLGLASDMVTDTQSALGLTLDETTEMVDQMAKTSSKSNTSVTQLGDAMLKIGATARGLSGGTQELSTMLGVLADNGIKGAEGGTHLRNILLSLQNACEDGTAYFEDIGIAIYDSDGNMRSMIDIVKDMQEELGGLSDESRNALLSGVFNKTDLAAINALLGTSSERFDELYTEIGDCTGAAQEMANTQLDNLAGDVTLFKSALEGTQIALSDLLTPALRDFVQTASEGLSNITEELKTGDITGAAEEFGNLIGDEVSKVVEELPQIVEAGGKLLTGLMNGITENIDSIADGIAGVVTSIAQFFGDNIGTFVSGAIEIATEVVTALIGALPDILVSLGEGICDGIFALLEGLPDMLASIIDSIANLFGTDFDGISETYVNETNEIIKQSDLLEEAWEKVRKKKEETIAGADAEFGYYQQLADELKTCYDENGNVLAGEEARVDYITGELSEALGLEKSDIEAITQGNSELADSIDVLLQKRHAEQILSAEEEASTEARKQRKEISEQMAEVEGQLADAQNEVAKAMESGQATWEMSKWLSAGLGYEEAQKNVQAWAEEKAGLTELQTEYGELESALQETYTNEAQYLADYERFVNESYDQIGQTVIDYNHLTSENVDARLSEAQREYDGVKKSYDMVKKMYQSGEATDAQMKEAVRSLSTARNNVNQLKSLQGEYVADVKKSGDSVVSAISDSTTKAINTVTSASPEFQSGGVKWMDSTQAGVDANAWKPKNAVQSAIDGALNADTSGASSLGSSIMDGVESSIFANVGRVAASFASSVNQIIQAGKDAAQSHSPSRVTMQLGKWMMQGLELGITNNADLAVDAMTDATDDVLNAMTSDVGVHPSINPSVALAGVDILNGSTGYFTESVPTGGDNIFYITNNIDGAENPEDFANRLVRQIKLEMRMA